MDYEKILESLKICSEVWTSCDGCSWRGERRCIANLTKAAAIAIETLLHTLGMAQRERDVVTKRMIELEQKRICKITNLPCCACNPGPCENRKDVPDKDVWKNEPLTLDELRQMDGEPVYCVEITGREEWLFRRDSGFADMYGEFTSDDFMVWDNYGKLWWCYRQKPEEDYHA